MNRIFGQAGTAGSERLLVEAGGFRVVAAASLSTDGPSHPVRETLARRNERVGNILVYGEGVFPFLYGPFTGGLGETGVIRMSTYGEKILGVEVDLSPKHRGVETSLTGAGAAEGVHAAESVCGNFSAAHADAYASAVEHAAGFALGERERRVRIVTLELERIYNHLLVIWRLTEAAAQKVLASHLGALFEEALRINAVWSGNRYLRGMRGVGGVGRPAVFGGTAGGEAAGPRKQDIAGAMHGLRARVAALGDRFGRLYRASLSNRNYLDRLHNIAVVDAETADWGSLTGPSLRACGTPADLRAVDELLSGFSPITGTEGDSLARMEVRAEEALQSCEIVRAQLDEIRTLGEPPAARAPSDAAHRDVWDSVSGTGIGACEGPSGVIVWWLDLEGGRITHAHVSTPSLFGFQVWAAVLRGHIFTDFPFALESFGLSFADAAR